MKRSLLLLLASCGSSTPAPAPVTTAPVVAAEPGPDPSSDSNPQQYAVKHMSFDMNVDFAAKVIRGTAKATLEQRAPHVRSVRFDVGSLVIDRVTTCDGATELPRRLSPSTLENPPGQTLETDVPKDQCVAITYATVPEADALLWLAPALTAGTQQPMLFTQSQPTYGRTWIPVQDTPGVRFSYDATVRVPAGVMPLMSAKNPQQREASNVYRFEMTNPVPSYLVALAVGDFAFKPIGTRTGVYAEPTVVDAAAHEFAEVEKMIETAEGLYGPYRWERYDILVLPPSFPMGGMENPRLTFLTPTVIVGDRSLVSLIAHELAHSWSGNLVTNSTWNDVWLNEGMTTYVENRIMEKLRGPEVAAVEWELGRAELVQLVQRPTVDSRLALTAKRGEDPDSAPGSIAYQKGAMFLRMLEVTFGRELFDAFMQRRFTRLAFTSSDSRTFEEDAKRELFSTKEVPWTMDGWLHRNGIPPEADTLAGSKIVDTLTAEATTFATKGTLPKAAAWDSREWTVFLQRIPKDVKAKHLRALDKKYKLTQTPNAMIGMRWFEIAIAADLTEAAPQVEAYLLEVGRRWLVRTLYAAMIAKGGTWRDLAAKTFERAKDGYHSITRDTIAQMLAGNSPPE